MIIVPCGIKKVINKVSLYTLCAFALPFFAYASSFEMPACEKKHNFEIDSLLKNRLVSKTSAASESRIVRPDSYPLGDRH